MTEEPSLKPVIWVGSSRKDLRAFPEPVHHDNLVLSGKGVLKAVAQGVRGGAMTAAGVGEKDEDATRRHAQLAMAPDWNGCRRA